MDYKIELNETGEQYAAAIKKISSIAKLPADVGEAYGAIAAYLDGLGIKAKECPYTAYFNMDMENLEVEFGFPVSEKVKEKDNIVCATIPAGKKVSCMYKGSYQGMTVAYDAINKWITENGYTPTGVVYEYYFNSPVEVPENELLTKIVFLVK